MGSEMCIRDRRTTSTAVRPTPHLCISTCCCRSHDSLCCHMSPASTALGLAHGQAYQNTHSYDAYIQQYSTNIWYAKSTMGLIYFEQNTGINYSSTPTACCFFAVRCIQMAVHCCIKMGVHSGVWERRWCAVVDKAVRQP